MISAAEICYSKGFPLRKACAFLFLFFTFFLDGFGQDPANEIPTYNWLDSRDLSQVVPRLVFDPLPRFVVNTEEIRIAIDTDNDNNLYILSFGKGIDKYDQNGDLLDDDFISESDLDNPLDLAIDNEGYIYVADYLASGDFFNNGKIKIFDPAGNLLQSRTILTSFYRPLGLDVDEQNVYVAEFNDGNQGPEPDLMSRVRIYDKFTALPIDETESVNAPFRIAVNSLKEIYVSQANIIDPETNEADPQVLKFNPNLDNPEVLPNITSPGSIVIDAFDYVHIIEYRNRVNFQKFINYENLGTTEALNLYNEINQGIDNNEFEIKIFDSDDLLRNTLKDNDNNDLNIEFPVDLAFNSCDRMYTINANTVGTASIDFDLEIYQRTPSFDITDPIAQCVEDFELQLVNGSASINSDDINNGSTDNCGIANISLSQSSFTEADVYNIIMTVTDYAGNQHTCTVQVTVTGEEVSNQAPTAVADSYSTDFETQLSILVSEGVLSNDDDADGDALTAQIQSDVSNGTLNLNGDGSFTYIPDSGFSGEDSFTYLATDGELNSNVVTVTITVNPEPNQAPTAVANSYPTNFETTLTVSAANGVLSNDTDPDGDALTAQLQSDVSNGTLNLNGDGSFTYTPDTGFSGEDTFTYLATDGELNSNVVMVTITVNPEPYQAPIATADSYSTDFETRLTVSAANGVLSNDTDPDGDALTAQLQSDVSNGTLNLNGDGSFTYIPDRDFSGEDTFTYLATDGELNSNVVTVTITVNPEPNQAPTAVADSYPTAFETTLTISVANGVLSNDTDPDGDALAAQLQSDVSNGTLNLNGDGSFTYTPDSGFSGEDTFTYLATDGELNSNVVTVTITVNPEPNQAPTAVADSYSTDFETTLTVTAANGVLSNDRDQEGDALTAQLQSNVSNGTLNLNGDGSFTYTPDSGFSGEDTFTYLTTDGELNSNVVTVTINVTANLSWDCPDDYEISPNEGCEFIVPDFAEIVNFSPSEAVISQSIPEGTILYYDEGQDITITASYEGYEEVCTISLVLTDDAPVLACPSDQIITVAQGESATLPDYSNFLEVYNCGDVDIVQQPAAGTSISEDTEVTFIVTDSADREVRCSFNVSVANENTLELSCPEDYEVFADENCQYVVPDFTEIVQVSPEGATIEQSMEPGSTTITNADPFITITASYDGQTESCDIYLLLKDEIAPELSCIADQTVTIADGESYTLPDYQDQLSITDNCEEYVVVQDPAPGSEVTADTQVSFTVSDQAGNESNCNFQLNVVTEGSLAIACPSDKTEALEEACSFTVPDYRGEAVVTNGDASLVTQTPAPGTEVTGSEFEVSLRIEENDDFDECSFLVTLEDNIAPQAICLSDFEIILNQGDSVSLEPSQIDNGSTDNCGDISLSLDKTEFTSADEGSNTVTLRVTDAAGNVAECETTVQVTVSTVDVNQPPVAYDEEYTTQINTTLNVSAANGVLVNDTDPENDELTAVLDTDVENGTLQLNSDGSFTYTPDNGFTGQDFFTYQASDGELNSNTIFVSINVVDNSGNFGCTSQVVLGLGPAGEASLDIELLYHGDAEGLQFSASQLIFDCDDIGENTVTLSYSGRLEGSCEIPVMVVDDTPPVLQLRDISIDLDLQGNASIDFEDINNGSFDECDTDVTYTLSKSSFSCKEVGENMVQVTAGDDSGNISTASAIVRVFAEQEICNEPLPGSEYIFIYPNPNSGSFKIATPGDVNIQRIEVFDKRGRFITARNFDSNETEYPMQVGPLQEGIYVLKLETNEGVYVKRMIYMRD